LDPKWQEVDDDHLLDAPHVDIPEEDDVPF
jgi:hypothetical protein